MEITRNAYCFICKIPLNKDGTGGSAFKVESSKPAFNKKCLIYVGTCQKCGKKVSVIGKSECPPAEKPCDAGEKCNGLCP
jgi:hypothetical protein